MNSQSQYDIIRAMKFDEAATHQYDIMRGGFIWTDEMPKYDSDRKGFLSCLMLLAKPIAHRSELTLEKENLRFEKEWNELRRECPDWPGFREERIHGERIKRELKAIKYKENKCFDELEKEGIEQGSGGNA